MKIKVGQKIKVKNWEELKMTSNQYDLFLESFLKDNFCEKCFTVEKILHDNNNDSLRSIYLKESDEMFFLLENEVVPLFKYLIELNDDLFEL